MLLQKIFNDGISEFASKILICVPLSPIVAIMEQSYEIAMLWYSPGSSSIFSEIVEEEGE